MKSIHIELDEYVMAGIGIIAGLLLLVFPQQSLNVITYAIGAVALIYGILKIVSYFRNREYSPLFPWELILGISLVGIGIFSFTNPGGIFAILPIILGVLVLIEGISKAQRAMMLQKYGYPKWQAALLAAVLSALLGVLLILNPFGALVITVRVLGGVILVDGIMGIWVGLTMKKFS